MGGKGPINKDLNCDNNWNNRFENFEKMSILAAIMR